MIMMSKLSTISIFSVCRDRFYHQLSRIFYLSTVDHHESRQKDIAPRPFLSLHTTGTTSASFSLQPMKPNRTTTSVAQFLVGCNIIILLFFLLSLWARTTQRIDARAAQIIWLLIIIANYLVIHLIDDVTTAEAMDNDIILPDGIQSIDHGARVAISSVVVGRTFCSERNRGGTHRPTIFKKIN